MAAGLVVGAVTVVLSISLAALIFTGELSRHLPTGIALSLVSATIVGLVVAVASSYPGTIAVPQDRTAPILALMAGFLAARLAAQGADPLGTTVAAIALASLLTGAVLLVLGWFRLGDLIRFIPHPVIGGLLAGTGWLLVTGSLRVMLGSDVALAGVPELFRPAAALRWLPGCLLGGLLFISLRKARGPLIMPGMLLGAAALFHAALLAAGVSLDEARARGFLFPVAAPDGWAPWAWPALADVHWPAIADQWSSLAAVVLVSAISILLNSSALEIASEQDIDLNTELRAAGAGNILAGLGGGLVGFQSISVSALPLRMGVRSRAVGLIGAACSAAALLGGMKLVWLFPRFLAGGLLFFLGVGFLSEWVVKARARLSVGDYAVTLLILGVMGTAGFLPGVTVGIGAALVLFVINYSRISVVKYALSGAEHRSNVDRPIAHERILYDKGEQTYILTLQGFIFFGTAHNLFGQVRRRALDTGRPRLAFAVLDFRRVTGIDSSALASFVKMTRLAEAEGFRLVLTHLPAAIQRALDEEGITRAPGVRVFPDLDHGVEMCENEILLAEAGPDRASARDSRAPAWELDGEAASFLSRLETRDVGAGELLIRQGDPAGELYFIESGQVSARLRLADGRELRLRTMGPGAVVGEMGLYLGQPRSASVVTDQATRVHCLSLAALEQMHREAPATAAAFHRFVASLLVERLAHANATLRVLFD